MKRWLFFQQKKTISTHVIMLYIGKLYSKFLNLLITIILKYTGSLEDFGFGPFEDETLQATAVVSVLVGSAVSLVLLLVGELLNSGGK